jgi:Tfp pilus assembly protein PilN
VSRLSRVLPADLNLAARPFANARPVVRVAGLLWGLALLLGGLDLWFYGAYLRDTRETQTALRLAREEIRGEIDAARRLDEEIRRLDVERQNERVAFLNRRIAERTFPWGRLFDSLAEVLPPGVRLKQLSRLSIADRDDTGESRRAVPSKRAVLERGFQIAILGVAETGGDLLAFVDALFGDPRFSGPDLVSEATRAEGLEFDLTVRYLAPDGAEERP